MKPPPAGIVWSGRRRRCPRCGKIVDRAWAVEGRGLGETEREWSCVDCLTPLDYGANGEPIMALATPEAWAVMESEGVDGWAEKDTARAWTERSCEAQGVPVKVKDHATLAKVAVLFRPGAR